MRVLIGVVVIALMVVGVIAWLLSEDPPAPDFEPPGRKPPLESKPVPEPSGPAPASVAPTPKPAATPPRQEAATPAGPTIDPRLPRVVSSFRQLPIDGAAVRVKTQGGQTVDTRTDRLGQFDLDLDPSGGGTIRVVAEGFKPHEAGLDAGIEGKVFTLDPAGSIQGRVVDHEGVPLPWAKIQVGVVIEDATGATIGAPWPGVTRVVTDKNGRFRLEALEPRGQYFVAATLPRLGVGVVSGIAPSIDGAAALVTIRLGGEASIKAVVVDPSGRAVFGPHAMLSGRPDGMPGDIIADDSGRAVSEIMRAFRIRFLRSTYSVAIPGSAGKSGFLFDKLPPGEYVLEIEAKGYKAYSAKIRVSKQDHVQHVAKLTLEDVALTGTVTDSAGRALSGAQVSVHTDGSTHTGYLSTATRPDGTFSIRGPKEWRAPLVLAASAAGFENATVRVPVGKKSIRVKLFRNGTVRGEVSLEDKPTGHVVFDFVRTLPQSKHERRAHSVRQMWKRFSFTLPHGKWTMRVTAAGYEPFVARAIEIPEGGEASGFRIVLRKK
jgi:protocatechuate 3,4-dioxygenase beta subunit